jgi:hypothetical protein
MTRSGHGGVLAGAVVVVEGGTVDVVAEVDGGIVSAGSDVGVVTDRPEVHAAAAAAASNAAVTVPSLARRGRRPTDDEHGPPSCFGSARSDNASKPRSFTTGR